MDTAISLLVIYVVIAAFFSFMIIRNRTSSDGFRYFLSGACLVLIWPLTFVAILTVGVCLAFIYPTVRSAWYRLFKSGVIHDYEQGLKTYLQTCEQYLAANEALMGLVTRMDSTENLDASPELDFEAVIHDVLRLSRAMAIAEGRLNEVQMEVGIPPLSIGVRDAYSNFYYQNEARFDSCLRLLNPEDARREILDRGVYYLKQFVPPREEPDSEWSVVFTPRFKRAITKADSQLKDRVYDALDDIRREPITMIGNTKRPLNNDKKGLWRYRVGDYRIVYTPCVGDKVVIFQDFGNREHVYH
jgi:mRNA interferase RelE/StbE